MLRAEIVGEVRRAMREVMEQAEEKWISGKELSATFSFFNANFLRYHGHLLPREHVRIAASDGSYKTTGWGYPLHKIERMVAEGQFREIEWNTQMKEKTSHTNNQ